jgi:hypothetical protein
MKNEKNEQKIDAVKMMREIRNKIYLETKNLSFDELKKLMDEKLKKSKLRISHQ